MAERKEEKQEIISVFDLKEISMLSLVFEEKEFAKKIAKEGKKLWKILEEDNGEITEKYIEACSTSEMQGLVKEIELALARYKEKSRLIFISPDVGNKADDIFGIIEKYL